jgi:hypothetical protein
MPILMNILIPILVQASINSGNKFIFTVFFLNTVMTVLMFEELLSLVAITALLSLLHDCLVVLSQKISSMLLHSNVHIKLPTGCTT